MKDCREIQNHLPDYFLGRVSDEDGRLIEEHLAHCQSCQAEAAELDRAFIALKQSETSLPPESYWQNFLPRLHERIEERKRSGLVFGIGRQFGPWIQKVLIPSAALVATIFVLTRIPFVPKPSSSELRQLVQEMNVNEMWEATETSHSVLMAEPDSRAGAVLAQDEETRQALNSLVAVSSDELDRFQQATLLGFAGTALEDLNDEDAETVITRLEGAGTQ